MVYLCLCGLAKMLQILNQQENYYVHTCLPVGRWPATGPLVKGSGQQSYGFVF